MRIGRLAVPLVLAIVYLTSLPIMHGQSVSSANTVEITEGPVIGRTVAAMKVMNSSCVYGAHYHFELTPQGELQVHAPLTCGKVNAGGGELVCILGPELSCRSRKEYGPDPDAAYAVDGSGVHAGGRTYAWVDPSQAAALYDGIRARATSKCNHVLYAQALETKRNSPLTSIPEVAAERLACKPVLHQACSLAHGGAAVLSNGKDVSVLCQR